MILVVSSEAGVRQGLTSDIARRCGADYTVAAWPPPTRLWTGWTPGLRPRRQGARRRRRAAGEFLPSDFLLRVHRRQPQAKRVLLIERGNWSSGAKLVVGSSGRLGHGSGERRVSRQQAHKDKCRRYRPREVAVHEMRRTLLAGGFVIGSAAFPKEPPLAFS